MLFAVANVQPKFSVIPTIPFTQGADSTQLGGGGSVPPPIDRAIDQQIGIINWGIIHPSSAMPFPLLHFHYASFQRRGTERETGHDRHRPLISILIKRPSDNDQSKQSAAQKIPEHRDRVVCFHSQFSSKFLQAWPKSYYFSFFLKRLETL